MGQADLDRLKTILRKMSETKPTETICLMGWETELILKYIKELERVCEYGITEVSTTDRKKQA